MSRIQVSRKVREQLAVGGREGSAKHKQKRGSARITVVVRKRPLSTSERQRLDADIVKVDPENTTLCVGEPRKDLSGDTYTEEHRYEFDRVYDEATSNMEVYISCVLPLVQALFEKEGARCSVFAYGQTGSGKTYTVVGPTNMKGKVASCSANRGLAEIALYDVYKMVSSMDNAENFALYVSIFEIYCNKVYDLQNDRRLLRALESRTADGFVLKDLSGKRVDEPEAVFKAMCQSLCQRVTGSNSKNLDSSRGHVVTTFEIRNEVTGSTWGKLAFVDLAGSERGADTISAGKQTQHDGVGINKSLLALKECIRAIDGGSSHVPFRDSELTKILRDHLVCSRAQTVMIAQVSPHPSCCEQTLNSIRYATMVRQMRRICKPQILRIEDHIHKYTDAPHAFRAESSGRTSDSSSHEGAQSGSMTSPRSFQASLAHSKSSPKLSKLLTRQRDDCNEPSRLSPYRFTPVKRDRGSRERSRRNDMGRSNSSNRSPLRSAPPKAEAPPVPPLESNEKETEWRTDRAEWSTETRQIMDFLVPPVPERPPPNAKFDAITLRYLKSLPDNWVSFDGLGPTLTVPDAGKLCLATATPAELKAYILALTDCCNRVFGYLHWTNHSCMKIDAAMFNVQGTIGHQAEGQRYRTGGYQADQAYVDNVRQVVTQRMLGYIQLSRAVYECDITLSIRDWVADRYRLASSEDVAYFDAQDSDFSSSLDDPLLLSK